MYRMGKRRGTGPVTWYHPGLPGGTAWGFRPVSAPGVRLFLVQCIRTQATVPKPAFVASNRVCQRPQPVAVHRADPASRDAKDALFLFILPGVWASLPRHAKDPVWFVSVTGHWPTSDAAEAGRSLAAGHQHGPAVTCGANATAPALGTSRAPP